MKKLYKFNFDCGRMGELNGFFISTEEIVNKIIGEELYFGEVLGKHSEICGPLESNDLKILTDDQDFIEKFEKYIGESTGYNPLDYLQEKNR